MFGPIKRKAHGDDKARKEKEQEETARVYAEFVKSFQPESEQERRFVHGGVIAPSHYNEPCLSPDRSSRTPRLGGLYSDDPEATRDGRSVARSGVAVLRSAFDHSAAVDEAESSHSRKKRSVWLPPTSAKTFSQSPEGKTPSNRHNPFADSGAAVTIRTGFGEGIGGFAGLVYDNDSDKNATPEASAVATPSAGKKREIDLFLEEIKRKQDLLTERRQLLQIAASDQDDTAEEERLRAKEKLVLIENQTRGTGSIPGLVEAEETTNLYIGNLPPGMTEELLCQHFGKFGKIQSVKIMYPRTEGDADFAGVARRLSGFCSFATRRAAENAKNALDGVEILGHVIRIGWGKSIGPKSHPVASGSISRGLAGSAPLGLAGVDPLAVHPNPGLLATPLPIDSDGGLKTSNTETPFSVGVGALGSGPSLLMRPERGCGFSDQPPLRQKDQIKVEVPKNPKQKAIIDLVAKYVAEEGHALEQMIIDKYKGAGQKLRFLCEVNSAEALYYRWRTYAFCQGDSLTVWHDEPFEMFSDGLLWIPPPPLPLKFNETSRTKSKDKRRPRLTTERTDSRDTNVPYQCTSLDEEDRIMFEKILRRLKRDRDSIKEALVFCIEHSESGREIIECLTEALTIDKTPLDAKIARLYLLSDILYNSFHGRQPIWSFRTTIEENLPEIFVHQSKVLRRLKGRFTVQAFRDRVMRVLRAWEDWVLYPPQFTKGLEASFLRDTTTLLEALFTNCIPPVTDDDPMVDASLDGQPINQASRATFAKYPLWLREKLYHWSCLDLPALQQLCRRRGLAISFDRDICGEKQDATDQQKDDDTVPSYTNLDQVLIRRLIEYEVYWRNHAAHISRVPAAVLPSSASSARGPLMVDDTTNDVISINTRDLIQAVVADIRARSVPAADHLGAMDAQFSDEGVSGTEAVNDDSAASSLRNSKSSNDASERAATNATTIIPNVICDDYDEDDIFKDDGRTGTTGDLAEEAKNWKTALS